MTRASKGIALITGAAQGIGRAVALRLADDGFIVALNDIAANASKIEQLVEDLEARGCRSVACIADVSVEEDVRGMITKAVESFPDENLTVLVANAGIARYGSILDMSVEDFDAVLATNARGAFLCYKYAAAQMIKQGVGGRIIGASSMLGKKAAPNLCAYSASKFAVRGLTQAAAQELGKHGITVNAYAPGGIDTAMLDQLAVWTTSASGAGPEAYFDGLKERTPLGVVGDPNDIANIVSFLASDAASFITGQSISVNGGLWFD
ncbi:NAD-binding protein [Mycena kentingensis (nom. inval.)]|nr:NAD-binding protein [Mycena kentingensis (nom. inval.)]